MAVTNDCIDEVFAVLTEEARRYKAPLVTGMVAKRGRDPFRVLIATIMSARTRDEQTESASTRLFAAYPDASALSEAPAPHVEELIREVGFFRAKARNVVGTAHALETRHGGRVPNDMDALLALPGVGRKTANLVITLGFGEPGICVDTHVHRITNRWGYVDTRDPEETEMTLRRTLPAEHWIPINDLLVTYGQNHCAPTSPRCSTCRLVPWCDRRGVTRSR
jgi:endonuclease III